MYTAVDRDGHKSSYDKDEMNWLQFTVIVFVNAWISVSVSKRKRTDSVKFTKATIKEWVN